jgi:hemolysin activation/secretion protein
VEADTTAFVARATLFGEYRPAPKFSIAWSARGQYAPHALLGYEEFSAGNFTVGRGYDPGVISGDSGYGASLEGRYGSLVPSSNKSFAWQFYGFTDASRVWNKDALTIPASAQRLISAGGGVRLAYGERVNLDIGGAFPLRKAGAQTRRADARLLVNLTIKLLPWTRR